MKTRRMQQAGRIGAAAALAVAALAAAGCGGAHSRRDAVNAYLDGVDRAQAPLAAQQASLNRALQAFSVTGNSAAEVAALVHARQVVADARRRVAAVDAPPEAVALRRDLVRMLARQEAVAGEFAAMARFLPRLARTLHPLTPAAAALQRDLQAAKGQRQIAAAVARFRASLRRPAAQLDALDPPPLFRPLVASERRRLVHLSALCSSVEKAIAAGDVAAANAALSGIFAGTTAADARRSNAAQRAAGRAYAARLRQIDALAAAAAAERRRLERTVR